MDNNETILSKTPLSNHTVEEVHDFWDDNVCGEHFINPSVERQTPEFFAAYRQFRYDKEHHLDHIVDWESAKGKDVLEIGLGLGADATRWAEHAKSFTGVDLTPMAAESTQRHLNIRGFSGKTHVGNAESLPFEDEQFDFVSSHGVLHHTPDTLQTLKEVNRVIRPNGEFMVMFYAKNSFNYWVRIQGLMRLRFALARIKAKLSMTLKEPWKEHYENYKARGRDYISWNTWPHHCTDGPGCEIAYIRTFNEMKTMLETAGFSVERARKAHFPVGLPKKFERFLARYLGFYQFIWCRKN
jgi:ubiquinone/menaquinone biosynthesis C-methylase UbiE